jgi:hypothetical protein
MQRTLRYAFRFRDKIIGVTGLEEEVEDLCKMAIAMKKLPNDINAAPSNATSAAHRMLRTLQVRLPFLLNKDSKMVMTSILEEESRESLFQAYS